MAMGHRVRPVRVRVARAARELVRVVMELARVVMVMRLVRASRTVIGRRVRPVSAVSANPTASAVSVSRTVSVRVVPVVHARTVRVARELVRVVMVMRLVRASRTVSGRRVRRVRVRVARAARELARAARELARVVRELVRVAMIAHVGVNHVKSVSNVP